MRRLLVTALEAACDRTGHRFGCRLATLSFNLDGHWDTQVWTNPTTD